MTFYEFNFFYMRWNRQKITLHIFFIAVNCLDALVEVKVINDKIFKNQRIFMIIILYYYYY